MHATRRYWTVAALGGVLAAAALVFARPLLVVGAAGVGAWLLVEQALFVRSVVRTDRALSVTQSLARDRVVADDAVTVALDAELARPVPGRVVVVEADPPVGATAGSAADRRAVLAGGDAATATFAVEWPFAGRFRFGAPTVTVTDELGLFESTFPADSADPDPEPAVTVVPRRPDDLRVGRGGEAVATAFGDHKTGDLGLGLDPGEVREFVPGDTLRQIDWKATARSDSPHVREFEEETDGRSVVVFDHRASMATGPEGERALDYARQVALAFADHARAEREPLGLYAVDDGGVTARYPPSSDLGSYSRIRTALHDIAPGEASGTDADRRRDPESPRTASRNADLLRGDDSAFAARLRPFFADSTRYVRRVADDPLYEAVGATVAETGGTVSAVVVTDDRNRAELREAVELARRRHDHVLVFLAPTVLFERPGLADVEAAYRRYADFEEFRRDLARLDGVSAFEVAPGDRLDALLATEPTAATTAT